MPVGRRDRDREKALSDARWREARNGNYKHGWYTAERMALRRWLRESIRELKALTRTLREQR
jgi:hypothetical protein